MEVGTASDCFHHGMREKKNEEKVRSPRIKKQQNRGLFMEEIDKSRIIKRRGERLKEYSGIKQKMSKDR